MIVRCQTSTPRARAPLFSLNLRRRAQRDRASARKVMQRKDERIAALYSLLPHSNQVQIRLFITVMSQMAAFMTTLRGRLLGVLCRAIWKLKFASKPLKFQTQVNHAQFPLRPRLLMRPPRTAGPPVASLRLITLFFFNLRMPPVTSVAHATQRRLSPSSAPNSKRSATPRILYLH